MVELYKNRVDSFSSQEKLMVEPWKIHQLFPKYQQTRLVSLKKEALTFGVRDILIKDESNRLGLNSFKPLGASYAIHSMKEEIKSKGLKIATATAGNHGLGVAYFANYYGLECRIVIPSYVNNKREKIFKDFGAEVVRINGNYDEAVSLVRSLKRNEYQVLADTAWDGYEKIPRLIKKGYFTMFKEVLEQIKNDSSKDILIFLQGGVGTFASSAIEFFTTHKDSFEKLRFCIVEPQVAACLYESAIKKRKTDINAGNTKAGCLACGVPNPIEINSIIRNVDFFLKIDDKLIENGIKMLKNNNIMTSYNGAIALAAFTSLEDLASIEAGSDTTCLFFNTEKDLI